MKTIKLKFSFLAFTLIMMIFTFSCEKPAQPDSQSAEDDARGSLVVADAFAFSNTAASTDVTKSTELTDCFTIDFSGIYPDRTMTLTFDSCESNGIIRNGQIIVALNGLWGVGQEMTLTFNGYSVNSVLVEGSVTIGYSLIADVPTFALNAQNMKLTFIDGSTTTWSSDKTFSMTAGADTPLYRLDDIFIINGTKTGITKNGAAYTAEYIDVESDKSCEWPKTGTVKISKDNEDPTIIDFDQDGSASCDNIINVTKGDITVEIEI